ncbi:FAD-dependent oxidoreductase [Nonomuraea sp. NPDC050153]|uniref:FAD-dependent oxidoreductase n=1 Tax=Nonomuraea sp. NPDC050153 TaxID=3364359 RepID=UPI003797B057
MRVIVAGAGLGGLTLAQGLREAGIDVVVYERDGARGRPQGISLHLDERGMAALRACLPPAHAAVAEATMGGQRERTLMLGEVEGVLSVVGARPMDGTAGRVRPGRQTHRPLLRAVLLAGLEDAVRFGTAFTRFERQGAGVRVHFSDGSVDSADVLVGADGIGSAVRRQFLPHVRVADSGRRMLMGAAPLRAGAGVHALIGHDPASLQADGMVMALGVLRFTQPPAAARDRWLPALRARAVDGAEDYVMWALSSPPVASEAPDALWQRARELARDLPSPLRTIVEEAWPGLTVALRGGAIPAMEAWPAAPVTLIGDAIHVAPGFGGNLAMQDAHRLRDALIRADRGEQDLAAAIGGYEHAMRRDSFPQPVA